MKEQHFACVCQIGFDFISLHFTQHIPFSNLFIIYIIIITFVIYCVYMNILHFSLIILPAVKTSQFCVFNIIKAPSIWMTLKYKLFCLTFHRVFRGVAVCIYFRAQAHSRKTGAYCNRQQYSRNCF